MVFTREKLSAFSTQHSQDMLQAKSEILNQNAIFGMKGWGLVLTILLFWGGWFGVFLVVHTEISVYEGVLYIVIFFQTTVTQSKTSVNEILKEKKVGISHNILYFQNARNKSELSCLDLFFFLEISHSQKKKEPCRIIQNNLYLHNNGFFEALSTFFCKWNSEFSETQILLTGSSGSRIIRQNIDKGNKFITKSWIRTPSLMSSFSWLIQKQEACLLSSPSNQEAKSAPESVLEPFQFTTVDLEQGRKATCSSKQ